MCKGKDCSTCDNCQTQSFTIDGDGIIGPESRAIYTNQHGGKGSGSKQEVYNGVQTYSGIWLNFKLSKVRQNVYRYTMEFWRYRRSSDSWMIYNNHGQRLKLWINGALKVNDVITFGRSGSAYCLNSSGGNKWTKSGEVTITSRTTFTYKTFCTLCESSGHANEGEKWNFSWGSAYAEYEVPVITPVAPTLSITSTAGRHYTKHLSVGGGRNYTVIPAFHCDKAPGSNSKNTVKYTRSGGSNCSKVELHIQYKRDNDGKGWIYCSGYPKTYGSATTIERQVYTTDSSSNYNTGDRYGNGNVYFCAWTVGISSTGHKHTGTYHYYVINDNPIIGPGDFGASLLSNDSVRLALGGLADTLNNGTRYSYVRAQRYDNTTGQYSSVFLPPTYSLTNSTHVDYTFDSLGVTPGNQVKFFVTPGDNQEWNEAYGNGAVTGWVRRPAIPGKPTLSFSASNNLKISRSTPFGQMDVYAGRNINSGKPGGESRNTFTLTASRPSWTNSSVIYVEHYEGSSWVVKNSYTASSVNYTVNVDADKSTNNYNGGHRHPTGYWRARCKSVSVTGHETYSDYKYWCVNDLPVVTRCDLTVANNSATLNYAISDNFADYKYLYVIALIRKGGKTTEVIPTRYSIKGQTSVSYTLAELGATHGSYLSFKVHAGDDMEWNGIQQFMTKEVLINTPPTMVGTVDTSARQYNDHFEKNITVSWQKAVDADNNPLTYNVWRKTKTASGTISAAQKIATTAGLTYNDSVSISRGDYVCYEINCNDGIEDSTNTISSPWIRRTPLPNAPNNIVVIGHNQGEYFESISNISWDIALQGSGANSYSYEIGLYEKVGSIATKRQTVTSIHNNCNIDFSLIARGSKWYVEVYSIDSFGNKSASPTKSKEYFKNNAPGRPPFLRSVGNSGKVNKVIDLQWGASQDEFENNIKYVLQISKNRNSYETIADNLSVLSHSYNVSNLAQGTTLGFRVKAIDGLGVSSEWTEMEMNHQITINYIPPAPIVRLPLANKTIYSKNPRICLEIPRDRDDDALTLYVSGPGFTYSSSSNPSLFNKRTYKAGSANDKATFIFNGAIGATTLKFWLHDGIDKSQEVSFVVNVDPVNEHVNKGEKISAEQINRMVEKMNKNIEAYGVSKKAAGVKAESIITAKIFNDLATGAFSVTDHINRTYNSSNSSTRKYFNAGALILDESIMSMIDNMENL